MDLRHFLNARLRFIQKLYNSAVSPFEETKRKIEAGEPPYVDERNPEYVDEPSFLQEWQEADDSAMVIGHWCLCMVQASLFAYLRECIGTTGSLWWDPERLCEALPQKKGNSLFERYRLLFLEDLRIDWSKGPVPLTDLEQLNLTRNDLVHNVDLLTFSIERDERHAERFPTALFTDDLWGSVGMERIKVTRDKLDLALRLVHDFCKWLDDIRCNYPNI